MYSSAPTIFNTIRTGNGNRSRVGSRATLGAESWYVFPRLEFAPARHKHVLHPLGLTAVGQGGDESFWRSKDVYGRSVAFPDFRPTWVRMPNPGSQPANKLVIRFVKMILIFASHRLRNRIMRTPEAAMATIMMAAALTMVSSPRNLLRKCNLSISGGLK
jgi:hypothetical protein